MKWIFLFLVIFLQNAFSSELACDLFDSTLEYRQLKCQNKNLIATEIRRNFKEALGRNSTCSDCVKSFPNSSKYLDLIKEKFLIIGFKENGYGGKFAYLVFETSNKIYSVWIYPIDKGIYQVRELRPRDPSEEFMKHISRLRTNSKIVSLWQ